mmetsp:Transcript_29328/g.97469  ORF Transcript_29328/g.97469 Transcript_29328/m.97469 type:complete len:89 (+) Transcript_29328:249-515(+)
MVPTEVLGACYLIELVSSHDVDGLELCRWRLWELATSWSFLSAAMMPWVWKCAGRGVGSRLLVELMASIGDVEDLEMRRRRFWVEVTS